MKDFATKKNQPNHSDRQVIDYSKAIEKIPLINKKHSSVFDKLKSICCDKENIRKKSFQKMLLAIIAGSLITTCLADIVSSLAIVAIEPKQDFSPLKIVTIISAIGGAILGGMGQWFCGIFNVSKDFLVEQI